MFHDGVPFRLDAAWCRCSWRMCRMGLVPLHRGTNRFRQRCRMVSKGLRIGGMVNDIRLVANVEVLGQPAQCRDCKAKQWQQRARDATRWSRYLWREVRLLTEQAHKLAQRNRGGVGS